MSAGVSSLIIIIIIIITREYFESTFIRQCQVHLTTELCMRNANECPKIPDSAMLREVE